MKFKLNDQVIVDDSSINIFSFSATIIDILEESNSYIVKDQDDDVFSVDEDKIRLD